MQNKSDLGICEKCKHIKIINVPSGQRIDASKYGFIQSCGGMNVEFVDGKCKTFMTGECVACDMTGKILRSMTDVGMGMCTAFEEAEH